MPHVIIKLHPGRSEEQKKRYAEEIARRMVEIIGCKEDVISISYEEVDPSEWVEKVYRPDILEKPDTLYKKPGYDPFRKN